ncbi:oxygenase MpaB family protein [Actinoplanes couchii]|uniref:ER-bound oxygenase mpaB/mpaB'/Rubber oxygenase catalytic domain-containing protein n=1 Tax=Actinoplanes couchii TaxID=403638 RepID=A0ABQ3XLE1_9ACTN|nr:oxygenase MpaB family protein [Actinoplanes couchii]MDR6318304.1 uncharacterized protein (DUF2236 family) [Actinoplanes couchii]GID59327.1 hypothetical protein Aco03nite_077310 [Actinoplanes couchii]
MDRDARRRRIAALDPAVDHREITRLFYLDFQSVMLLQAVTGNLMTFAVPRMSRILDATGQFTEHTARRFIDTTLLVNEVLEHGLDPGPGRDAARRVNGMHRHYDIHPDDFVAVGCDVPLMSLEIADRFGWRPVLDAERESLRLHFSAVARAFGSHHPMPPALPQMRARWDRYLDEQVAYEPQNERLTRAFLNYLPTLLPRPVRPLINPILTAQVDPRILRGCGLPLPSRARRRLSTTVLRTLGRLDPRPDSPPGSAGPLDQHIKAIYPYGWSTPDLGTHH